ncbi:MAG: polyamine ABC transporter ATP-binding protein [Acidimicrobiia bacterium]|nr:polyamine ABC transporter ATP-binding protein [Acidimicrobiia bacterium]MDH4365008.1 polyamine ABC transporter ATP-binding protein [Acidimicrobiia bacterium]
MGDRPAPDDVIVLQGIRKEFGSFVAVEHADFSIARSEFFSLLGPSGCGKTTLLKMIAGFEQPTEGHVLLEGRDVSEVPPHQRNVNTVFQQYALFPHMSVLDNVAFGLRAKRVPEKEVMSRSKDMLDAVKLGEFAHRRPSQLSGGQQQRVALARALVNLPSALLLDEPLAALDLKLREAMQLELKRIQREVGITFIFVTHDQHEALTMSDRIAVMSRGRVEQIGTPEEIYGKPASVFVAGFIGSANLLPGEVASESLPGVVLDAGSTIDVPTVNGADVGSPVTVMIRPERLRAVVEPVEGRSVSGTISDAIFEGSTIRLIVHLSDGTELMATVDADDNLPPLDRGNPITLAWADDAPYVLQGRSAIVGATTTDVDEVQASLEGKDAGLSPAAAGNAPSGRTFGRRALLGAGGLLGAAAVVGGVLKITGNGGGSGGGIAATGAGTLGDSTLGSGESNLRVLNWQAYIDPTDGDVAGTIDRFKEATGIQVQYAEDLNDNNEFYAREIEPYLGTGTPTNWDIVCPTNWLAARMKALDWLEPLPIDRIPNRVNLEPQFLTQSWDYGSVYHVPWQAGITGIAYNKALTGRDLGSINDLFDPALAGRVSMLTEMRDSVGLTMLALGLDPTVVDEDGALAALDKINQANAAGQFRAFSGGEYLRSLQSGDFVACIAWSGDIVQLQLERPDISFVIPEEGGMLFYDTMVIPKGAANGLAAADWINFVYDPVQAAQLTSWVQYISPVKGVREELVKLGDDGAALAENPILFPDEETSARLRVFAALPDDVDARLNDVFNGIIGG